MNTRHTGARTSAMEATRLKVKSAWVMKRIARGLAALSLLWAINSTVASGDVADKRACQEGQPHCTHFVIQEMERRFRRLAKDCDHDAIFSLLYLRTTEKFRDTLSAIGYGDPSSVVRQDAVFADYYFRAYDAFHNGEGFVPPAWQIAFAAAGQRKVTAAGNALLGINAHIQRDLAFTLFDLDQQGRPVSHADHTLVNNFLAQVMADAEIADRFDPTFDDNSDPAALLQLIFAWREQAFTNYLRLRDAPTAEARASVAAEIEGIAAATAAGIVQQTAYPPGADSSLRDAFCAEMRK
ncbi:MAG TPA: DUF5995 family protein [Blastocatellia bacterium]|nr:DUF5995 family protein [Blastocatellia bacterium]